MTEAHLARLNRHRKALLWVAALVLGTTLWLEFDLLARDRAEEVTFRLILGWGWHLGETVPHLDWDFPAMVKALGLMVLAATGAHAIFRSLNHPSWPFRSTLRVLALSVLLIGAAGAAALSLHHASWLPRESIFYFDDRSDGTINISNARQLITALRIYAADHNGAYPEKLEDLVTEEILDQEGLEQFSHALMQKQMKIPWLVLGGLSDAAPGNLPLVVSPVPLHGRRYVLGTNDSGVHIVQPEEFDAAMGRWVTYLKENHKTRSAIPLR